MPEVTCGHHYHTKEKKHLVLAAVYFRRLVISSASSLF